MALKKGKFTADYLTLKGHKWTREGRRIYRDGEAFIYIDRTSCVSSPVEADEASQLIEYLFNELSK